MLVLLSFLALPARAQGELELRIASIDAVRRVVAKGDSRRIREWRALIPASKLMVGRELLSLRNDRAKHGLRLLFRREYSSRAEWVAFLDGYLEGAIQRNRGPDLSVRVLAKRYEGRIRPASDAATWRAMHAMLVEWRPLGKRVDDLERIVGVAGTRSLSHVDYVFDDGFTGVLFRFRRRVMTITGVELLATD